MLKLVLLPLFLILTLSCSSGGGGGAGTKQVEALCTDVKTYSNSATITGKAVYEYRVNGNGAVAGAPNPIRQAEVTVYDGGGSIIQCGSTDDNGDFSVTVAKGTTNVLVKVKSRVYNSVTKAYIINNPSDMALHSISSTALNASADVSAGVITAKATGTLEGGAFNILDKIVTANTYLATETTSAKGCGTTFTTCTSFSGIPLVHVYWSKGVNPGTYFNAGAVSFYIPGEHELYILGGSHNDVDNSDTDHFDNSIIIHEYGHFIEDVFSKTDSPGGTHDGNSIIDARLAWGEGWANFFQAAVLQSPVYLDTIGTPDGTPDVYFDENLETPENDIPSVLGEGNFREFSITRLLWDAIDDGATDSDADGVHSPFSELWTTFTNATNGFKYGGNHFRNMGLFHQIQNAHPNKQDWSALRTAENQRADQRDYARSTVTSGSACTGVAIQAQNDPTGDSENGTASRSNQFASNDFYQVYHSGGTFQFGLAYTTTASTNLDVYIYPEAYKFGSTTPSASATTVPSSATAATESIAANLPAGYYIINIRVNTKFGLGTSSTYTMTLNGANLCPN